MRVTVLHVGVHMHFRVYTQVNMCMPDHGHRERGGEMKHAGIEVKVNSQIDRDLARIYR